MRKIFDGALILTLLAGITLFVSTAYYNVYLLQLGIVPSVLQGGTFIDRIRVIVGLPLYVIEPIAYIGAFLTTIGATVWTVRVFKGNIILFRFLCVRAKRFYRHFWGILKPGPPMVLYRPGLVLILIFWLLGAIFFVVDDVIKKAEADAGEFLSNMYGGHVPDAFQVQIEGSDEKIYLVGCGSEICAGLSAKTQQPVYLSSSLDKITARGVGLGKKASVVVFQKDAVRGDHLTMDKLAIRDVPASRAPSDALRAEDIEKYIGRTLAYDMKRGVGIGLANLAPQSPRPGTH
jgi:hypothetical protein